MLTGDLLCVSGDRLDRTPNGGPQTQVSRIDNNQLVRIKMQKKNVPYKHWQSTVAYSHCGLTGT